MTKPFQFIWGNRELLNSRKRETIEDHSPIPSVLKKKSPATDTYARTDGFSYRTNRDKHQAVGKLYTGEDDDKTSHQSKQNDDTFAPKTNNKLTKKLIP